MLSESAPPYVGMVGSISLNASKNCSVFSYVITIIVIVRLAQLAKWLNLLKRIGNSVLVFLPPFTFLAKPTIRKSLQETPSLTSLTTNGQI